MSMELTDGEFIIRRNYDAPMRVRKQFFNPSMVKESFKEETDINTIMQRFQKTGVIEHTNKYQGNYGDFTFAEDFHTSINKVIEANDMFMTLPSSVRARFGNDTGAFLEFVSDDANEDAMREIGLLPKQTPPQEGEAGGPSPANEAPQPSPTNPAE